MKKNMRYPLWGKAGLYGPPEEHHALPAHLLSVAAVFSVIIEDPQVQRSLQCLWGENPPVTLLVWTAALHDLGKTHKRFQEKRPDVVDVILGIECNRKRDTCYAHGEKGFQLFRASLSKALAKRFNWKGKQLDTLSGLLQAACAHHGYYPWREKNTGEFPDKQAQRQVVQLAEDFISLFEAEYGPLTVPFPPREPISALHCFAGWVVLADWLGSDENTYPFIPCDLFDTRYGTPEKMRGLFREYRERAKERIAELGVFAPADLSADADAAILGAYASTPNALQKWIMEKFRPGSGPCLLLLEAPMGMGKTEAALLGAARFIRTGCAHGLAFALPTQASTNQIHRRLSAFSRELFGVEPGKAHGDAAWERNGQKARQEDESGEESIAHLHEWLSDDSKKAFLAPACAATVDQMELAAMHSRHGFLRAAALGRQATVIDEIHAYDAYMQTILDSLLRFLGAMHTPVVLLSATLPSGIRRRLVRAYCRGADIPFAGEELRQPGYPLITRVSDRGIAQMPLPWEDELKTVEVICVGEAEAERRVLEAARAGACVCVLCNTVGSALRRYTALSEQTDKVELLHARFRKKDRQNIEEKVLGYADKASKPEDRKGRILVATQVVEQSLDLDFDLLITEVAPIDLILQRLGRLHRHERERPDVARRPQLAVIMPETQDEPWFRGTQAVYREGEKLEPSMAWLREREENARGITLPADIPEAVMDVYGETERYNKRQSIKEEKAKPCVLNHDSDITSIALGTEHCSATRSGDGSVKVLLVIERYDEEDGQSWFIPFADNGANIRLPPSITDEGNLNSRFLETAHPWLLSVRAENGQGADLSPGGDFGPELAVFPEKYKYRPFRVFLVRKSGNRLRITNDLYYSTERGLYKDGSDG
ncbi:MAG: CRISPR-associated helicase Cas3' [Gammaproteobacteria bacterium]|nr:CRISPR-associated helicase Cas3' [Gammaproteobacteria bacterium]